MRLSDIGVVGLAVMGENLTRNLLRHGFAVSVYDINQSLTDHFMATYGAGQPVTAAASLEDFLATLARPRKVLLLIRAGDPVDQMITRLLPLLEPGDCIIDCGNSHYPDTARRCRQVEAAGMLYVGSGVSGGGEGALRGPSLMPGGSPAAWPLIQPMFQAICAQVDGEPVLRVGRARAAQATLSRWSTTASNTATCSSSARPTSLMRDYLGMTAGRDAARSSPAGTAAVLDSYLIEITADILSRRDTDGTPLVEQHPRHRRAEGHRQMGRHRRAGRGHPLDADFRGRVQPLPVRPERAARRRGRDSGRRDRALHRHRRGARGLPERP